jgi:SAM-dependent methyltransferase
MKINMNPNFLDYLVDPETREDLRLEVYSSDNGRIITGRLYSSTNSYEIVDGIPRFVKTSAKKNYASSFGFQWNRWPKIQFENQNLGRPMEGHTSQMFRRITTLDDSDFKDKLSIDFGCGSGRFLDLVSSNGGFVIGLDLSDAVESAGEIFKNNPKVLVCQADILHSPIRDQVADFVYSIGVLHHTPSFREGVAEISRVAKDGSLISISVYGSGGYYDDAIVTLYRRFFNFCNPLFGYFLPWIYSVLIVVFTRPLYRLPRVWKICRPLLGYFPCIQLRDIRWSILDTFDSLTPKFQRGINHFELFHSLQNSSIVQIAPSDWGGTALTGKKLTK